MTGLDLELELFPRYAIGLPAIASLSVFNRTPSTIFSRLPHPRFFFGPGPVEFSLASRKERRRFPPASEAATYVLGPGESRTMLLDLSDLPEPRPGSWLVSAAYEGSAAAPVEAEWYKPEDALRAAELRYVNDVHQPSWSFFLLANWRTVDASGLSEPSREILAFHLWLHRAIYGPTPVARLDPPSFSGPLAREADALRAEILHARGEPVESRHPGLAWRIEEIRQGRGLLTTRRRWNGAEKEPRPEKLPYT